MFTMLVSIFIYFASLFVLAVISAIIGVYVYRDSKIRGMNMLFWTVIGVALNIPGLITYMIARKTYFKRKCPACMADTHKDATYCPECGVELDTVRPKLGFFLAALAVCFIVCLVILIMTVIYSL